MDLYIIPMTCSFTAHVACLEAGIDFQLKRVRRDKTLEDGRDFSHIAPQCNVPAIGLSDGSALTESSAVLQWIADQAPDKKLAPEWGTEPRYRLVEWLNFVSTELHKKHLWMIFSSKTPPAVKDWARASAPATLAYTARHLEGREFVVGDTFTVADAYLYWALYVLPHGGVRIDEWRSLRSYVDRLSARKSIQTALAYEGPLFLRDRAELQAEAKAAASPASA